VRTRPAGQPLRPYGPRPLVRALLLAKDESSPGGNGESADTDRFRTSAPHH